MSEIDGPVDENREQGSAVPGLTLVREIPAPDLSQEPDFFPKFPEFEPVSDLRHEPGISEEEVRKIEKEYALYEVLKRLLKIIGPVQEVFEKHDVPLVITRSVAIYLWALSLHQGHLIPVEMVHQEEFGIEGDTFNDVDLLVPVDMLEEVEAALKELNEKGIIKLSTINESNAEPHPRGLTSYLFRQFSILDEAGKEVIDAHLFSGLSGKVDRDGETDVETLQSIRVNENGEVVSMYNEEEVDQAGNPKQRLVESPADVRGISIGGVPTRFLIGKGLEDSYKHEQRVMADKGPDRWKDALLNTRTFFKLRLIEMLMRVDPQYQTQSPHPQDK